MTVAVGTIYYLKSRIDNAVYIGSTSMNLEDRIKLHRYAFKRYNLNKSNTRYSVFDILMYNEFTYGIFEQIDINTYDDYVKLREIETIYINHHRDNCVNYNSNRDSKDYLKSWNRLTRYLPEEKSEINKVYQKTYQKEYREKMKELKKSELSLDSLTV
jgi:hypothetical protein